MAKTTIIVNGTKKKTSATSLTYSRLVTMASKRPSPFQTITYRRGPNGKQGMLAPRQSVEICDGMIFDVTYTGSA